MTTKLKPNSTDLPNIFPLWFSGPNIFRLTTASPHPVRDPLRGAAFLTLIVDAFIFHVLLGVH